MPTGYTAKIKDGQTFNEFLFNCAKAFGACIDLKDEPMDTPIPEKFEESTYYECKVNDTIVALRKLHLMTISEYAEAAEKEYQEEVARREKWHREQEKLRKAYKAMLQKAKEWVPPTDNHHGLKSFMIEQINRSIDFDCGTNIYASPVEKKSGAEWYEEKLKKYTKDLEYYKEEASKEKERTADKNAWIKALRESI